MEQLIGEAEQTSQQDSIAWSALLRADLTSPHAALFTKLRMMTCLFVAIAGLLVNALVGRLCALAVTL